MVVTKRYERLDDEEELEMVSVIKNNSKFNVVSDSNSDSSKDDF